MVIKRVARKNVQNIEETLSFEMDSSPERTISAQDTDADQNSEASVEKKNPSSSSHSQSSTSESSSKDSSNPSIQEDTAANEETESVDDVMIIKTIPAKVANRIRQTRSGRTMRGPAIPASTAAEKKTPVQARSAKTSGKKKIQEPTSKKRKVSDVAGTPREKRSKKKHDVPAFIPSEAESEEEAGVGTNAPGILSGNRVRSAGKRIPPNVPSAPIDNISFHSEECAIKWKYVFQRRVARERELGEEALNLEEIVSCIAAAGMMKTVTGIGRCYEKLIKEFIVNVTPEVNVEGHSDYHKVFVRGRAIEFSPSFINRFLGREDRIADEEVSLNQVAAELTAGKIKKWPSKGLLKRGDLSVKYAIFNKIAAANWVPTNHTSSLSVVLAKLIYLVGTTGKIDFGSFIFDQTMKHASSYAIKIPIAFPSIITEIILLQYPDILKPDEVCMKMGTPLNFDERMFTGTHAPDIAAASVHRSATEAPINDASRATLLAELTEISKSLQATIDACTLRKTRVDLLIKQLQGPEEEKVESDDEEDEEEDDATTSDEE